jgi:hypothetical protein
MDSIIIESSLAEALKLQNAIIDSNLAKIFMAEIEQSASDVWVLNFESLSDYERQEITLELIAILTSYKLSQFQIL